MPTNDLDFSEEFLSKYLKAKDFEEGEKLTLTIKTVGRETFEDQDTGEKVQKIVLGFNESKQGLVLNKSNGALLKSMFGTNGAEWIGKTVNFLVAASPVGSYFKAIEPKLNKTVVKAAKSTSDEAPF